MKITYNLKEEENNIEFVLITNKNTLDIPKNKASIKDELESLFSSKEELFLERIITSKKINFFTSIKEEISLEDIRILFGKISRTCKTFKKMNVNLKIPFKKEKEITAALEGIELGNYSFDKYYSEKKDNKNTLNIILNEKYKNLIKETKIITKNMNFTKDLVNESSYIMTPKKLETLAKEFAKKNKLKTKILDEKQIVKQGLNLLNAVGRASKNPPRLIIVEYNGNPKSKTFKALVGKGITFDTGGVNLKPTGAIESMRIDMGGAATVFGAFKSAVELKIKENLLLVMSCAENAIGGDAYNPGDVYKSYSGKYVEIVNTDAEGRLVLADALSYVQDKYNVEEIIDMATLTGASMVALGENLIALFSNEDSVADKLFNSGELTGDRAWRLPIYDEHRNTLKSITCDIRHHHGGRMGGCIVAAAFLESFIEKGVTWSHLDIAGAAYTKNNPNHYIGNMATGRGVRLVVDYLKN
jgi:leucyl aminopeptidase